MAYKKKNIILDCDLMRYPHSGLYYYCLNLGRHVQQILQKEKSGNISFYVPPAEANSFDPGSKTIVEKKRFWNFLNDPLRNCDVWHAPFQSGRIVPDKKKYPHIKVVLTIHDLNQLHEGKPQDEQRKSIAHVQSLIDKSDAIICISNFCKKDVLQNCDVANKSVYVIHNGSHAVERAELNGKGYRPDRPFLFGMGYVNTKKNFHVLLPLLKDENLELLVAGRLDEPDYIDRMKEQAELMGVADRLRILGPVSEGEKAWYFENCLAFVHPSLAEGFGAPVVEVMQFGKPLFLSSLTSLPEVGGDSAFYFSSFEPDHMRQVFYEGLNTHQKEQRAEKVKAWGRQFDWNEKAKEYIQVYLSL
jgi:glycosyltransferase involved in cell wall biosynthesis